MSFKPLDIQASMPRTLEMTSIAQQQQTRPAAEQAMLGQQAVKQAELQARRNSETEKTGKSGIRDRSSGRHGGERGDAERKREDEPTDGEARPPSHPHKGKHIDFFG